MERTIAATGTNSAAHKAKSVLRVRENLTNSAARKGNRETGARTCALSITKLERAAPHSARRRFSEVVAMSQQSKRMENDIIKRAYGLASVAYWKITPDHRMSTAAAAYGIPALRRAKKKSAMLPT